MYYADILPRHTGEMLGDMLLQMGKPAEAPDAHKAALELAPKYVRFFERSSNSRSEIGQQKAVCGVCP